MWSAPVSWAAILQPGALFADTRLRCRTANKNTSTRRSSGPRNYFPSECAMKINVRRPRIDCKPNHQVQALVKLGKRQLLGELDGIGQLITASFDLGLGFGELLPTFGHFEFPLLFLSFRYPEPVALGLDLDTHRPGGAFDNPHRRFD